MARPPAVVIVARHGARLDAADSQWHLTSPTPYDPPLTYGGWRQSQALGAKIASIISIREAVAGPAVTGASVDDDLGTIENAHRGLRRSYNGKKRKHKVVIHTSPFLRCIQTAVAISAGMAQYQGATQQDRHKPSAKPHVPHSGSPHVQALDDRSSPLLSSISEPAVNIEPPHSKPASIDAKEITRTILRVDAFLGEWLSPDYFEKITPPPGSKMMIASAKADLLRREDPVDMTLSSSGKGTGNFPGGWNGGRLSDSARPRSPGKDQLLSDFSALSKNLPRIARANSQSVINTNKKSVAATGKRIEKSPAFESTGLGYVAPTPSYAVSPSQPIPQGYVAHARDACVNVDYQWDSMRPPLEWGTGGEYGEEWSSMHRRYRRGLHEMITWYRCHDLTEMLEVSIDDSPKMLAPDNREDDEIDTVVVLVTHGAGCNALIGALTNQPVLMDVGMASLTMAVRKDVKFTRVGSPTSKSSASPPRRRHSIIDFGVSDDYDVKVLASTDHLRAGSQFLTPGSPKLQRAPTLPVRDRSPYRYERPGFISDQHTPSTRRQNGHPNHSNISSPLQPALPELHEEIPPVASFSSGLWSKPVPKESDSSIEPETAKMKKVAVVVPNLDGTAEIPTSALNGKAKFIPLTTVVDNKRAKSSSERDQQGQSIVPNGLWGAAPQALATERDKGAKRRWTLSQAA
ncbi:hypothetical protein MMC21_008332 [Puttea exsequens]|nr:hypothetical protein [Puttea exsequens]